MLGCSSGNRQSTTTEPRLGSREKTTAAAQNRSHAARERLWIIHYHSSLLQHLDLAFLSRTFHILQCLGKRHGAGWALGGSNLQAGVNLSSAGASWKSPHLSWKDGTGAARTGQPMASGTRGSNCIQNAPVLTCWSFCLERGISTAPNTEKIPNTEKSHKQAPTAKQE